MCQNDLHNIRNLNKNYNTLETFDTNQTNNWKCVNGIGTPVRCNADGSVECASSDGKNCKWGDCPSIHTDEYTNPLTGGRDGWANDKGQSTRELLGCGLNFKPAPKPAPKSTPKPVSKEKKTVDIKKEIQKKINAFTDENNKLMGKLEKSYNQDTSIMQDKYDRENMEELLLNKQASIVDRNDKRLQEIKSDIETRRRQLEIGENQFKRKSFIIFLLKNVFILLCLLLLVVLLVRNNNLNGRIGRLLSIIIIGTFSIIIIANLVVDMTRNNNRFNMRDWWFSEPSLKATNTKSTVSGNINVNTKGGHRELSASLTI